MALRRTLAAAAVDEDLPREKPPESIDRSVLVTLFSVDRRNVSRKEAGMAKAVTKRKRKTGSRRPSQARGSMAPWYLAGVLVVAGIALFENRAGWFDQASASRGILTGAIERKTKSADRAFAVPRPKDRPAEDVAAVANEALPPFSGKWFFCTTQKDFCIIDGGTILYAGKKVLVADIDAPLIADAGCDAERARGGDAKLRLREILNQGDFTLASISGRSADGKGHEPRVLMRDGRSLGQQLVQEGLARNWTGKHRSWCS
jgi:endonuclease YncB( thermonuclease family)